MKNFLHAQVNGYLFHTSILVMSSVFKVDNHTFLLEPSSLWLCGFPPSLWLPFEDSPLLSAPKGYVFPRIPFCIFFYFYIFLWLILWIQFKYISLASIVWNNKHTMTQNCNSSPNLSPKFHITISNCQHYTHRNVD